MRPSCILLVSALAVTATREPPPAAGLYSLSQMQDYLVRIGGDGTAKTIGKVEGRGESARRERAEWALGQGREWRIRR